LTEGLERRSGSTIKTREEEEEEITNEATGLQTIVINNSIVFNLFMSR